MYKNEIQKEEKDLHWGANSLRQKPWGLLGTPRCPPVEAAYLSVRIGQINTSGYEMFSRFSL